MASIVEMTEQIYQEHTNLIEVSQIGLILIITLLQGRSAEKNHGLVSDLVGQMPLQA